MNLDPILLTDEQMRRFIVDGYLAFKPELPAEFHEKVCQKLDKVVHKEGNPGNNILPAVPEMQTLLDTPEVRGAMQSVLGANYLLHPHRFVHNNEPRVETEEGVRAGAGSALLIGWHQDSHSPLARPRHHFCRYAMLLYYPQNTPPAMGPTQLIPGTQYSPDLTEEMKSTGHIVPGEAGSCILVHFDIGHGGSLNIADKTRFMVKWVFTRVEEPTAPTWNCLDNEWKTPETHEVPIEATDQTHIWNWFAGEKGRGRTDISPEEQVSLLNLAAANSGTNGWIEDAIVFEKEAYLLTTLGKRAVPALIENLKTEDEWTLLNTIFALGEIGSEARAAVPQLLLQLNSPSHPVVRTALDALGQICQGTSDSFPEITALMKLTRPEWQNSSFRKWTGQDQVRVNAAMALLRIGDFSNDAETAIIESLQDSCGYVGGFGVEYLLRNGSPTALKSAIAYLKAHRWDDSLMRCVRTF